MRSILVLLFILGTAQMFTQSIDFSVSILDINESSSSFRVTNSTSFGTGHLFTYGPTSGSGPAGIKYFDGTESRDLLPVGLATITIVQKTSAGVLVLRRDGLELEYYFLDTEAITPRYVGNLPLASRGLGTSFNDQFFVIGGDDLYTINESFTAFTLLIEGFITSFESPSSYVFNDKLFLANAERVYVSGGRPENTEVYLEETLDFRTNFIASNGVLYIPTGTQIYTTTEGIPGDDDRLFSGNSQNIPTALANLNPIPSGLLFMAKTGNHGWEVWRTEGTRNTTDVTEVWAGTNSGVADPYLTSGVVVGDGYFIFRGGFNVNRKQIWYSDGTDAGTELLEDMPNEVLINANWFVNPIATLPDGRALLHSNYARFGNPVLWLFDKENISLESVGSLNMTYTSFVNNTFVRDSYVYFNVSTDFNSSLLAFSTADNTVSTVSNGLLLGGVGPQFTDGFVFLTPSGNSPLYMDESNLSIRPLYSTPADAPGLALSRYLIREGSFQLLMQDPDLGPAIYDINDDLNEITFLTSVLDINGGANIEELIATDSRFYFNRNGNVYTTDGTIENTELVLTNTRIGNSSGSIDSVAIFPVSGPGFRLIDERGTALSISSVTFPTTNRISQIVVFKDKFYFTTLTHLFNNEAETITLMSLDPNTSVIDTIFSNNILNPPNIYYSLNTSPVTLNDTLFFQWMDENQQIDLWKISTEDTTPTNTNLLSGNGITGLEEIVTAGNGLYAKTQGPTFSDFNLISISSGSINSSTQVFNSARINGIDRLNEQTLILIGQNLLSFTDNSTVPISLHFGGGPNNLEVVGNMIFFLDGLEYYRSDGTVEGTENMGLVSSTSGAGGNMISVIDSTVLFSTRIGIQPHSYHLYDIPNDVFIFAGEAGNVLGFGAGTSVAFKDKFIFNGFTFDENAELHFLTMENILKTNGVAYHDQNQNGAKEPSEPGVKNLKVTATDEDTFTAFSNSSGEFRHFLPTSGNYLITPAGSPCWELSSSSSSYQVDSSNVGGQSLAFGFIPKTGPNMASLHLSSGPIRCGFTVPFWITVSNTGCDTISGSAELLLDEEVSFVEADRLPSEVLTDKISWTIPGIAPGEEAVIYLTLQMPSEEFNEQLISFPIIGTLQAVNGSEPLALDTFNYQQTLSCAIDPNDKLAYPQRPDPSESNYTLTAEEINYTIRFQNTGTDTAFTIRLEDQLDTSLSLVSFRPISASHAYRVSLSPKGELEVIFNDIMLPDSAANQALSNGYFAYAIIPREEIEDFTPVNNTAGIFFDYNAPIITNTTLNTLVETLDADEDGFLFWEDCEDLDELINPDAIEILGNDVDENCDGDTMTLNTDNARKQTLSISPNPFTNLVRIANAEAGRALLTVFDANGRLLKSAGFTDEILLDLADLPSGLYLVRVSNESSGQVATAKLIKQ